MLTPFLVVLAAVALVYCVAAVAGNRVWESATRALQAELAAARREPHVWTYAQTELDGLPPPVQRYFRAVLADGQPMVAAASFNHHGMFNTSEAAQRWKPFRSAQKVVVRAPGFVWNGRIDLLPGLPVRVHDAYLAGEGVLHPALFGLVSLARQRGRGDLAQGELMRFLAEATWYPTALLPSQGVRWEPIDDRSARATLVDRDQAATLTFQFNERDLVDTVRAESRGRIGGSRIENLPWQGHFWDYAVRAGMLVPLQGEVAWVTAAGPMPYWRGTLTSIEFEFAPPGADAR